MSAEKRSGYLALILSVTIILTLVLSVLVNLKLTERNDQRNCGTLRALITAYAETPPTTPAGKNVEKAYRQQYALYDCKPRDLPISPSEVGPSPIDAYPSNRGN